MYKQCDDCKGIFKIPNTLLKYFEKHPLKHVYCPYCSSIWHHVYYKTHESQILNSVRGDIF